MRVMKKKRLSTAFKRCKTNMQKHFLAMILHRIMTYNNIDASKKDNNITCYFKDMKGKEKRGKKEGILPTNLPKTE